MKNRIVLAVLLSAASTLTPARATTYLYSTTPMLINPVDICLATTATTLNCSASTATADYVAAVAGHTDGLSGALPPGPDTRVKLTEKSGKHGNYAVPGIDSAGLGLAVDGDQIGPGDFLVLDFSHAATYNGRLASSVGFGIQIDAKEPSSGDSYWVIYGLTSDTSKSPSYLTSGELNSLGKVATGALPFYDAYAVGIIGDCEIDVNGIEVGYGGSTPQSATPEPGSFVMAGLALIGLGMTVRRRRWS